jgi:pre-mRNA-splicing factor ATP-dependent RNA helicase DHX15/PRP43
MTNINDIGILDFLGKHPNPITNNTYTSEYIKYANIWSKFPAYQNAKQHITDINNNNVLLVISGTGSGKTVLFPKFLLHSFNYQGKIAVTLPKQIIAKSAAEFSAKTLDVELTKHVGYQFRGSSKNGKTFTSDSNLIYMTDGTLVARLLSNPTLDGFNGVIIDEAHERKTNIDFLLYLLKHVLSKRKDFKLIIMSATIDENLFKNYYSKFNFKTLSIGAKTNYPIESKYIETNKKDYLKTGCQQIKSIINNNNNDIGIIFFVTSIEETKTICKLIDNNNVICIPVFSGMDKDKQELATNQKLFLETYPDKVKLIIATNVAESSLTIDGIDYVIDCGLELKSSFEFKTRINTLEKSYITKAQVKQRKGRTGRTQSGTCYHLYSKDIYDKMDNFPKPSILNESISNEMMRLLNTPLINNISELKETLNNFIEPPTKKQVKYEIKYLQNMNMIDDNYFTQLGKLASELQLEPMEALMIILSYRLYCFNEIMLLITITTSMNNTIDKLFNMPKNMDENMVDNIDGLQKKFESKIGEFNNSYGNHIGLLKLVNKYREIAKRKNNEEINKFTKKYFLKTRMLEKINYNYKRNKYRYFNILKNNLPFINEYYPKVDNINTIKLTTKVLMCIQYGLKLNTFKIDDNKITIDNINFLKKDEKKKKKIIYYNMLFRFDNNQIKSKVITQESSSAKKYLIKFDI